MKTIAIDIDGTLRDLDANLAKWLEQDHPEKLATFESNPARWDRLDEAFGGDTDSVHRWIYDERAFHLFGQAPKMYPKVIDHLNALNKLCKMNDIKLTISSVQRDQSIMATLFWLSKNGCKVNNYAFHSTFKDKVDHYYDYVVDDRPYVLESALSAGSVPIVVPHPYNEDLTEDKGYKRLDYDGSKPTGLAEVADLLGLTEEFQVIEE